MQGIEAMFHHVFGMYEHGIREMKMGDMWRDLPKFREIYGGGGILGSLVSKIIKVKIKMIKSQE
jgi:hypothetical protein